MTAVRREWSGPWIAEDVPHYVYRVYDGADRLLYIGCTKDPAIREATHRRTSPWGRYAVRFDFEGPYTKSEGYRRETAAYDTEGSFFNATTADRAASQANRIECRRRLAVSGIPSKAYFDDDAVEAVQNAAADEYVEAMGRMRRSIAETHPYTSYDDRMAAYLTAREELAAADSP